LNCTSKGFSCNFLDLAVRQSPQGLSCDIFDKCSQPEYAGIEMIRMPHVHSNISMTAKLGVINSQFYRFLMLCSRNKFFIFLSLKMVSLKVKAYSLKIILKRTRGSLFKEKFVDFPSSLVSGELLVRPLVHSISLFSFPSVFLSLSVSLFFSCPFCCGLLLASSMAESSHCFRNCSRNSVCRLMLVTAFAHCWELMKSVGKLW